MLTLTSLSDEELNKLVASDNAPAMREKAQRYLARGNVKKARQFFTLSSILGDRMAHIELARICEEDENFEEAYELYARAYSKGEESVLPRIAILAMRNDPVLGMELLRQNAAEGHWGCIKELINIYQQEPDNPTYQLELAFWVKRLADMETLAANNMIDNTPNKTVPQMPTKPSVAAASDKKRKPAVATTASKKPPAKKTTSKKLSK